MHVLVIPSWYPSASAPLFGSFILEQAQALAETQPDVRVTVSTWGHADTELPLTDPRRVARTLQWRAGHLRRQETTVGRLTTLLTPTLQWSGRLPGGGLQRMVNVNRRNWAWAEKLHGPIDVVHAHVGFPAGLVADALWREKRVPWVLTEHMGPFPFPELLENGALRPDLAHAYGAAHALMAVSPALADAMVARRLRRPVVVPNVVDERVFRPGPPPPESPFVFFALGGLQHIKGQDVLLRALALWNPRVGDVEVHIGGQGPEADHLRALARQLGVADHVRWLGTIPRAEAPLAYQRCHAVVLPSRTETFGVVAIEALATGKPVVATRCGGPESILRPQDGLLVAVDDPQALAHALATMRTTAQAYDPAELRDGVLARFARQPVANQLMDVYRRAIRP